MMEGHRFQNIEIKDSTVVLGNIESHGGVAINPKTAASPVPGHTQKSLRPVASYVARSALYQELKRRLHDTIDDRGLSSKIVVVCGLGGAGKSQLVLSYIQRHRQDYAAVFWIEAGSKTTLERDYVQIWRLISQSTQEKISLDDAVRGIIAWLHGQDEKKWLLVFDSADSIDDEEDKDYIDLNTFIPDASCVDVIMTTRSQTAKGLTDIEEIKVGDLDEDEALELLLRCSKIKDATEIQKQEAASIVKELGYFALAVTIAGAYIAATPRIRSRLETYLPEYRKQRRTILGRKARQQVDQYRESVLTTWEASYAAIANQCPEALGLLSLIAFLSPDDIFYELFTPLIDRCFKSASIWSSTCETTDDLVTQASLDAGFETLERHSLLSWKDEQGSYAMHKLVHTWIYDRMTSEEQRQQSEETLAIVGNLLRQQEYSLTMRARLLPHLMSFSLRLQERVSVTSQLQEQSLTSLTDYSEFLRSNGNYAQCVEVCRFRRDAGIRMYGSDEYEVVMSADHWLALMLTNQGQWQEAERLGASVSKRKKTLLGAEHPRTLTSMDKLALTLSNEGRWVDAKDLQVKAMEAWKRVLGDEHPDKLTSMTNLAMTFTKQSRYPEAEKQETKLMNTREKILGVEHPDTLQSMENLGVTYYKQRLRKGK